MTIESILGRSWLFIGLHVRCIDQRDELCLHYLHGGIFRVLSDVWSVCTI